MGLKGDFIRGRWVPDRRRGLVSLGGFASALPKGPGKSLIAENFSRKGSSQSQGGWGVSSTFKLPWIHDKVDRLLASSISGTMVLIQEGRVLSGVRQTDYPCGRVFIVGGLVKAS